MSGEISREVGQGDVGRLQQVLQVRGPLLHQVVDVGHRLVVVNAGGGLAAVQVGDVSDPFLHGGNILTLNFLDPPGLAAGLLTHNSHVKLQHVRVGLLSAGLV